MRIIGTGIARKRTMKKNKVYITGGTRSFNPLVEMIPATNTQEAFAGAKLLASVLGMKHVRSIGLILFVRFSKAYLKKIKLSQN